MASGVPKTTQVVPGAPVNIVLKADQRTGRQVTGVVRDVLTRGDHHRGIKVRLADGRIGRVQSMARPGGESTTEGAAAATTATGEGSAPPPPRSRGSAGRFPHHYEDVRFDGYSEPPREQVDLAAYMVAPKKKGKGRKPAAAAAAAAATDGAAEAAPPPPPPAPGPVADVASANVTCPVCAAFEGDETAVAHHVATHFE